MPLHAGRTVEEVSGEIESALDTVGQTTMIIRKSAQEIAKMAAAGRVVAETIAHVGEQLEPGSRPASSTGSPTSTSARAAASRRR